MIRVLCQDSNDLQNYQKCADNCFNILKLSGEAALYLNFVNDEQMRDINFKTRNCDNTTDVLSFPLLFSIMDFTKKNYPFEYLEPERAVLLGDIVINIDAVERQKTEYQTGEREVFYLFTHGLLHLLGYDHANDTQKSQMRLLEEQVLNGVLK